MTDQIDSLDKKIISFMQADSRMPFLEIARELKVSGGTIHARVKKLKSLGVLKGSKVIVDPMVLGYKLSAFIGIQLSEGSHFDSACENLRQIPQVLEVHYTTGGYSLFCRILVKETAELYEILSQKIQRIQGVQSTQTLVILNSVFERDLLM